MRKGYIYILQSVLPELRRFTKVGKTVTAPSARFQAGVTQRCYFKDDIIIYGLFLVNDVDGAEKAIYDELSFFRTEEDVRELFKFDPLLTGGLEWFPATPEEAAETVKHVADVIKDYCLPESGLTRLQFSVDVKAGYCVNVNKSRGKGKVRSYAEWEGRFKPKKRRGR